MPVTDIKTAQEYKDAISGDKPAVIDFWAEWCGPCKIIKPVFKKMSELDAYSGVAFYSMDTEGNAELEAVSEEAGVSSMPTFLAFHKGNKIGTAKGAIPKNLEELLKKAASADAPAAPAAESAAPVEAKA